MSTRAERLKGGARKICLLAFLTAVLTGGKAALSGAYNIEIVTLLFILYALILDRRDALLIFAAWLPIEGLIWGFQPYWILPYAVYWPLLILSVSFLPKSKPRFTLAAAVALGVVFTAVLFGPLHSVAYVALSGGLGGGNFWRYVAANYLAGYAPPYPFELVHIVSNAVILPIAVPVLYKPFKKAYDRYRGAAARRPEKPPEKAAESPQENTAEESEA